MSYRKLIRSLRRVSEAGHDPATLRIDDPELAEKLAGVPFVVDAREVERADLRRYRDPLTYVGPVKPGTLREFEEPKP